MVVAGKVVGGLLGALVGGPAAAVLGVGIGHQVDRQLRSGSRAWRGDPDAAALARRQTTLLLTQFSLAGMLARAGRVPPELGAGACEALCGRLGLDRAEQAIARRAFADGQHPDFPLPAMLNAYRRDCRWRVDFTARLLESLLWFIHFDGPPLQAQRRLVTDIAGRLGVSAVLLVRLEQALADARQAQQAAVRRDGRTLDPAVAYAVLNLPRTASAAEIRRAYRREMSRHHPDRLVATGATAAELGAAAERTDLIRKAYETLREVGDP